MVTELITKNIINAFTGTTPVKAIYRGTNKIWESGSGPVPPIPEDYELVQDGYMVDSDGMYHERYVKYGEDKTIVSFETPVEGSTYGFVEDTVSSVEKLDGYTYLMSNNKGMPNSFALVKLYWEDIDDFDLYYRSNAERYSDYLVISTVDAPAWVGRPTNSSPNVQYNTSTSQGTDFKVARYQGSGSHHIYVAFTKDITGNAYEDRGYIYFKNHEKSILDEKSGELLPYEYVWYGSIMYVDGQSYKKLIYTATLPNTDKVTNENKYIPGEQIEPITEWGGLTFEGVDSENTLELSSLLSGKNIQYAISGVDATWNDFTKETKINLKSGDKVFIKGNNPTGVSESDTSKTKFKTTGQLNVSGKLSSIMFDEEYENKNSLNVSGVGEYALAGLFEGTSIVDASKLEFFNDTSVRCYYELFKGCKSLTKANNNGNILPSPRKESYYSMFANCTSLVDAPSAINAPYNTANYACFYMFNGCKSLTSVPTLGYLSTGIPRAAFSFMFGGCTSLTSVPDNYLQAPIVGAEAYQGMFSGCTSLKNAPTLPATSLGSSCYSGMFSGCTSLTQAPALPATTLVSYCYSNMFNGCTSLTSSPILRAEDLVSGCYNDMFNGCTNLSVVKTYQTVAPSTSYSSNWLNGVKSTGTFFTKQIGSEWRTTVAKGTSTVPEGWEMVPNLV